MPKVGEITGTAMATEEREEGAVLPTSLLVYGISVNTLTMPSAATRRGWSLPSGTQRKTLPQVLSGGCLAS